MAAATKKPADQVYDFDGLVAAVADLAHAVRNLPEGFAAAGFGGTAGPDPRVIGCLAELVGLIDGGFRMNDIAVQEAVSDARVVVERARQAMIRDDR